MEECLICKAPLQYLSEDILMECSLCHKSVSSKTRCINGHFVCDDCHTKGVDSIYRLCMTETSRDPVAIIEKMMAMPFCHMHGPEHHIMVGSALLTAYKNSGGNIELSSALNEMHKRGSSVPGGACGYWGACGAGVSAGMYISIVTGSTPLAEREWSLSNRMTSLALDSIGKNGGPRCCKRDSYLAIISAVEFTRNELGVEMEMSSISCSRSSLNNQCIRERCPFFRKGAL